MSLDRAPRTTRPSALEQPELLDAAQMRRESPRRNGYRDRTGSPIYQFARAPLAQFNPAAALGPAPALALALAEHSADVLRSFALASETMDELLRSGVFLDTHPPAESVTRGPP